MLGLYHTTRRNSNLLRPALGDGKAGGKGKSVGKGKSFGKASSQVSGNARQDQTQDEQPICALVGFPELTDIWSVVDDIRPSSISREKLVVFENLKECLQQGIVGAEVVLVGSVAKRTDIGEDSDIDLLLLLSGAPGEARKKRALYDIETICVDRGIERVDRQPLLRNDKYVRGALNDITFDLHVGGKDGDPEPVELHVEFLEQQPPGVREVAVLVKWWLRTFRWKPSSFLIELLAAGAARSFTEPCTQSETLRNRIVALFRQTIDLICNWQSLHLTWDHASSWTRYHCAQAPLVLDPADETNNLAHATVSQQEELVQHCQVALGFINQQQQERVSGDDAAFIDRRICLGGRPRPASSIGCNSRITSRSTTPTTVSSRSTSIQSRYSSSMASPRDPLRQLTTNLDSGPTWIEDLTLYFIRNAGQLSLGVHCWEKRLDPFPRSSIWMQRACGSSVPQISQLPHGERRELLTHAEILQSADQTHVNSVTVGDDLSVFAFGSTVEKRRRAGNVALALVAALRDPIVADRFGPEFKRLLSRVQRGFFIAQRDSPL